MNRLVITAVLILLSGIRVSAQGEPIEEPGEKERIQQLLAPPDLIMRNQSELGLTSEQEQFIVAEIRTAQTEFTELRWALQREMDELERILQSRQTNEQTAIIQLDRVLELEQQMKKARFLMAYRITRQLTEEQFEKVQQLRGRRGRGAGLVPRGQRLPARP